MLLSAAVSVMLYTPSVAYTGREPGPSNEEYAPTLVVTASAGALVLVVGLIMLGVGSERTKAPDPGVPPAPTSRRSPTSQMTWAF